MAKIYFEKLSRLLADLRIEDEADVELEVKHFFSGAALYANRVICVSWSPGGLAFRMPESRANRLIDGGKAIPLRYFAKGHIKTGYAMFEQPECSKKVRWKNYILQAIDHVS